MSSPLLPACIIDRNRMPLPKKGGNRFILPRTLTLITTYRCTAACEHCCFDCTPKSEGTLSQQEMLEAIDAAHSLKTIRTVVFSGGECFLTFDSLLAAVCRATEYGMSTRCVTNGYWAKDTVRAQAMLDRLKGAGLKELNISTGDQHLRFVPLQSVENAAKLAVEAGLITRVVVEEREDRHETAESFGQRPTIRALLHEKDQGIEAPIFDVLESPWMPMDHRQVIESQRFLNARKLPGCGGCTSIFQTIVRSPEGKLGICCGLPRRMIQELNQPFDAQNLASILSRAGEDFLKIWLYVDGPEKILAWAASHDPEIEWENRFAHQCHSCLAIYKDERVKSVIRRHYRERVEEVLLRYALALNQQDHQEAASEQARSAPSTSLPSPTTDMPRHTSESPGESPRYLN